MINLYCLINEVININNINEIYNIYIFMNFNKIELY